MSEEKHYIGIDPGVQTGWAYRGDREKWHTGTCRVEEAEIKSVMKQAIAAGVDTAAIENQYCGKNIHTLQVMTANRAKIEVWCQQVGLKTELVYPSTWQAGWGITGKREQRKAQAKRYAVCLGATCRTQDEADAVLICEHAACVEQKNRKADA